MSEEDFLLLGSRIILPNNEIGCTLIAQKIVELS